MAIKSQEEQTIYDIIVYGDSSGAVTAAIAAKRQGHSVILVNPTCFLGGMSASGLGATDYQNSQGQFLCPVRLDWLVEFPFQDDQLAAQEESFQVFFLLRQTADTHEQYQC